MSTTVPNSEKPDTFDAVVDVGDERMLRRLSGSSAANLRELAERTGTSVGARGTRLQISGPEDATRRAERAAQSLVRLIKNAAAGREISPIDVAQTLRILDEDPSADIGAIFSDVVAEARGGRVINPRTLGQAHYVQAIRAHDVTFGVGPAGTGKTYLAMALATDALRLERIARIILTRPAVEAGERLGFLPGDLEAKVDPYLRPVYDALYDLIGAETTVDLIEKRVIEVAPLAFMRGRTLSDAFVILDEAQNTTREQMKMFLTRLGSGSKMVINGDLTQTDLGSARESGLGEAVRVLSNVNGVGIVELNEDDVVRHDLVRRIIRAYDKDGTTTGQSKARASHRLNRRSDDNPQADGNVSD